MKKIIMTIIGIFTLFLFTSCGPFGGGEGPIGPGPDDHEHFPDGPDEYNEFTITIDNDNGDELETFKLKRGESLTLKAPSKSGYMFLYFMDVDTKERLPEELHAYKNMNIKAIYEECLTIDGKLNGKPFTFSYSHDNDIMDFDLSSLGLGDSFEVVSIKVYKNGVLQPESKEGYPVSSEYSIEVEAYRMAEHDILYDINDKNEAIIVRSSHQDVINIPSTIAGLKVTEIRPGFYKEKGLDDAMLPSSIIFPKTIKKLPDNLFAEFDNINFLYLPKELETIGKNTFKDNVKIDMLVYGGSEQELKNISKDSNLPSSSNAHYVYNREISEVTMHYEGDYNYWQIDNDIILSLRINNSSKTIFDYHDIVANPIYFDIMPFGFSNTQYTKIILPDVLTRIPRFCFYDTTNLQSFTFPRDVKYVEQNAFTNSKTTEIITNDKLEYIYSDAFASANIAELYIGDNVKFVGSGAFDSSKITSFNISANNKNFTFTPASDVLVDNNEHKIVWGGKHPVIPDDVKIIGKHAFYDRYFSDYDISFKNVEIIEDEAFFESAGLGKLYLTKVKTIGKNAFDSHSIKELNLYSSLQFVDEKAFSGLVDTVVHFENNGNSIFEFKNESLMLKSEKKVIQGFKNCSIPDDAIIIGKEAYANTEMKKVILPDSLTTIEESGLRSAIIKHFVPNKNLKYIGTHALGYYNYEYYFIPEGVEVLDEYSLDIYVGNAKVVYLPKSIKEIKSKPFEFPGYSSDEQHRFLKYAGSEEDFKKIKMTSYCRENLMKYIEFNYVNPFEVIIFDNYSIIRNKLTNEYIDLNVFNYVPVLDFSESNGCNDFDLKFNYKYTPIVEKVILPVGIKTIPSEAFEKFNSLNYLVLPNTVTTIENDALKEIEMIYVPKSVKNIAKNNILTTTIIIYEGSKEEFNKINIDPENDYYPDDYYYERLDSTKFFSKNRTDIRYTVIDGKIDGPVYVDKVKFNLNLEFKDYEYTFTNGFFKTGSKATYLFLPNNINVNYNFLDEIKTSYVVIPNGTSIKTKLESNSYVTYYVSERKQFVNFPKGWQDTGMVYYYGEWGYDKDGYPESR